jgi:beta-glucosidase-like glycosyl hydrolase
VISDALNMHSVSKLFDKKRAVGWEAFNAGNDVLCFENVPDGIQEILKTQILSALSQLFPLMKCKHKSRILGGNHIVEEELDFETAAFEPKIALNSITKIKTTEIPPWLLKLPKMENWRY